MGVPPNHPSRQSIWVTMYSWWLGNPPLKETPKWILKWGFAIIWYYLTQETGDSMRENVTSETMDFYWPPIPICSARASSSPMRSWHFDSSVVLPGHHPRPPAHRVRIWIPPCRWNRSPESISSEHQILMKKWRPKWTPCQNLEQNHERCLVPIQCHLNCWPNFDAQMTIKHHKTIEYLFDSEANLTEVHHFVIQTVVQVCKRFWGQAAGTMPQCNLAKVPVMLDAKNHHHRHLPMHPIGISWNLGMKIQDPNEPWARWCWSQHQSS